MVESFHCIFESNRTENNFCIDNRCCPKQSLSLLRATTIEIYVYYPACRRSVCRYDLVNLVLLRFNLQCCKTVYKLTVWFVNCKLRRYTNFLCKIIRKKEYFTSLVNFCISIICFANKNI